MDPFYKVYFLLLFNKEVIQIVLKEDDAFNRKEKQTQKSTYKFEKERKKENKMKRKEKQKSGVRNTKI